MVLISSHGASHNTIAVSPPNGSEAAVLINPARTDPPTWPPRRMASAAHRTAPPTIAASTVGIKASATTPAAPTIMPDASVRIAIAASKQWARSTHANCQESNPLLLSGWSTSARSGSHSRLAARYSAPEGAAAANKPRPARGGRVEERGARLPPKNRGGRGGGGPPAAACEVRGDR